MNFNRIPQILYLFLTLIAISAVLAFSFRYTMNSFDELSATSYGFLEEAYKKELAQLRDNPAQLTDTKLKVLENKVLILEDHKLHHITLVEKLFRSNYATFTLFPVVSAITAILAFFLLQRGWQDSHLFLKVFFVYFAALSALAGVYPEVYQQNQNINKNLESYRNLSKIQKSIFNYALTAEEDSIDSDGFRVFIDSISQMEKRYSNQLDFVIEKRSTEAEIFDQLNSQ